MNLTQKILADVESDKWEKEVEAEIDTLCAENGEYYPFTLHHVEEAITQQNDADWFLFAMYGMPTDSKAIHSMFHDHVIQVCTKYWREVAREQAECNVNARGMP